MAKMQDFREYEHTKQQYFNLFYSRVTKEVDANSSEAKSLQKSEKSEAEVESPVQKPAIG